MADVAMIEMRTVPATASRAQLRMAQAKAAARDHVKQLEAALATVARLASEVAHGGDAYPAGVRDVCTRLNLEAEARGGQIAAITRPH